MLAFARDVAGLFLKGRLFADPGYFSRRLLIGVLLTAGVFIAVALAVRSSFIAAVIAGFIGGTVQPYLSKDVKFR
jgi:hypothetical protein